MTTETETPPLAPDEAEEVEQDEPQPEPIEGPDEPEARAPQADTHALIEKAERANRNYTKRLREIFGADTTLYDCVHCNGLGVTFEPEDTSGVPTDLKMADNLAECEHCNAYGFNLTPSKNPDHATAVCTKCSGIGYIVKTTTPAPLVFDHTPPPAAPQTMAGQWIPGTGFVPYGSDEPLPNTVGLA